MDQLEGQLAAVDVVLDDALLDRIDEIVLPGITLQPGRQLLAQPITGARSATTLSRCNHAASREYRFETDAKRCPRLERGGLTETMLPRALPPL